MDVHKSQMLKLTLTCTSKLLPIKSRVDNWDITDALRRRIDELRSPFERMPLVFIFAPFDMIRGNVGRFGIPLFIELMATSEKFLRIWRPFEFGGGNSSVFISGKSSSSSSLTVSMHGGDGGAISTSITSSFICHFTGCNNVDPKVACNAKPAKTSIAPLNANDSSNKRTICGNINIPPAVPAIDKPTACPRLFLK